MSAIGAWTSLFGSGAGSSIVQGGSSSGFDWGGLAKDFLSSGSSSSSWGSWASKFLGGSGSSSGSNSNIYSGILAGLGGAASAYMDQKAVEEQGKQQRKTVDFSAALEDYYNQKNKVRKRAALDTYGQFSTMSRWAPGAQAAPPIDMPNKPGP